MKTTVSSQGKAKRTLKRRVSFQDDVKKLKAVGSMDSAAIMKELTHIKKEVMQS